MNEAHSPQEAKIGLPPQQPKCGVSGDPAKAAAKELYFLTCEMHAELWRLERMAQAYKRFDVLQLKTGVLSAQADAILRKVYNENAARVLRIS